MLQTRFLKVMLNGTVINKAINDEKQIIIVIKIDVLSEIDKRIIKKEITNSVVEMPAVNRINASRKVLIHTNTKKHINGYNSTRFNGTRINFTMSQDKTEEAIIETEAFT